MTGAYRTTGNGSYKKNTDDYAKFQMAEQRESYIPFLVFLTSMHEVHGINEIVHCFLLLLGGYVWMLGDDLAFFVDEIIERCECVFANVICEGHLYPTTQE